MVKIYPSQEEVKRLLDYDPVAGTFIWRERTPDMFSATVRKGRGTVSAETNCSIWNGRFAGKLAGSLETIGYLVIRIGAHQYKAHLIASIYMTGSRSAMMDHENLGRSDNCWTNIRSATRSQNNANVGARENNRLGVKGVTQRGRKFEARISFAKKCHYLGRFDTLEGAANAVSTAAGRLHGKFARTTGTTI